MGAKGSGYIHTHGGGRRAAGGSLQPAQLLSHEVPHQPSQQEGTLRQVRSLTEVLIGRIDVRTCTYLTIQDASQNCKIASAY